MKLAVTGPRPNKIGPQGPELQRFLVGPLTDQLAAMCPTELITGMAPGIDTASAWIAHLLGVPFTAAIPCLNQDAKFTEAQRATYWKLMGLAVKVVYVSDKPYEPGCMDRRNEWMVDHSDVLLAVIWPGYSGGTANCVKYAESVGRKVVRVDPRSTR